MRWWRVVRYQFLLRARRTKVLGWRVCWGRKMSLLLPSYSPIVRQGPTWDPWPAPCQAKEMLGTSLLWTPTFASVKYYPQNTMTLQGCVQLWSCKQQTIYMGQQHAVPLLTEGVCRIGFAMELKAEGNSGTGQSAHSVLPWKGLEQREWWRKTGKISKCCGDGHNTPKGRASPPC